jgi:hypothetical protein
MSANLTRVAAIPGSRAGLGGQACELERVARKSDPRSDPLPKLTDAQAAIQRAVDGLEKMLFDRVTAQREAGRMERDLGISAVCGCGMCREIRSQYLRGEWP